MGSTEQTGGHWLPPLVSDWKPCLSDLEEGRSRGKGDLPVLCSRERHASQSTWFYLSAVLSSFKNGEKLECEKL